MMSMSNNKHQRKPKPLLQSAANSTALSYGSQPTRNHHTHAQDTEWVKLRKRLYIITSEEMDRMVRALPYLKLNA